jgi:Trypsin-like peptidase domain
MPRFEQCMCPLWILERGVPELIGTGTLLKIEAHTFLITAAHVIDSAWNQPLLIGGLTGLKQIGGHGKSTQPASGLRKDDRNDTAVIVLDQETTSHVETAYAPLPIQYADVNDFFLPQKPYAFFGFPWRKGGKKSFGFQAMSVSESDYISLGLSILQHIVVEFDLKHAIESNDRHRRELVAPNPQGMSGGPVWSFVSVDSDGQQILTRRLAGIAIEYISDRKMLVGIRINVALECARMMFPSLLA